MASKKCPTCGHPMTAGPLEVRRAAKTVIAKWYCANCHHFIAGEGKPADA